jgi:hypothetical protein
MIYEIVNSSIIDLLTDNFGIKIMIINYLGG